MRKRDKYLIASITAVVSFAAAVLWLSHGDHEVPDSLIGGWFTFWSLEIYQIARITVRGKKESEDNYD